jgi:hypothetical protein
MTDDNSTRLLRLGKQIADLERTRRSIPLGYAWVGDDLLTALRAEKQLLEDLVAMSDLAGGGGSEPPDPAARKTATPGEAGGPQSDGTEATPELPAEHEAAGVGSPEVGTDREPQQTLAGAPQGNSTGQQNSASIAEPVSADSGASDSDPHNGGDVSDVALFVFIRDKCGGKVKARDLQRRNGKRWPDAGSARAKLSELVHAGLLEWEEGQEGESARLKNAPAGP